MWNTPVDRDAFLFTFKILRTAKRLLPDRFPKVEKGDPESAETVKEWARVLVSLKSFPGEVWPEAVRLLSVERVGEKMCTPRDLRDAAKVVLERWEAIPHRREQLRLAREARRAEMDRQISDGSFAELRGFSSPRALEGSSPAGVPVGVQRRWREVLGKFQGGEAA